VTISRATRQRAIGRDDALGRFVARIRRAVPARPRASPRPPAWRRAALRAPRELPRVLERCVRSSAAIGTRACAERSPATAACQEGAVPIRAPSPAGLSLDEWTPGIPVPNPYLPAPGPVSGHFVYVRRLATLAAAARHPPGSVFRLLRPLRPRSARRSDGRAACRIRAPQRCPFVLRKHGNRRRPDGASLVHPPCPWGDYNPWSPRRTQLRQRVSRPGGGPPGKTRRPRDRSTRRRRWTSHRIGMPGTMGLPSTLGQGHPPR
jgi:hypothetical protein